MAEQETIGMESEIQEKRTFKGGMATFIGLLALAFTFFEIGSLQFWTIDIWIFEAVVLALVMILGFLTTPFSPRFKGKVTKWDWAFVVAGVAPCLYVIFDLERLRWQYGSDRHPSGYPIRRPFAHLPSRTDPAMFRAGHAGGGPAVFSLCIFREIPAPFLFWACRLETGECDRVHAR